MSLNKLGCLKIIYSSSKACYHLNIQTWLYLLRKGKAADMLLDQRSSQQSQDFMLCSNHEK